MYKDVWHHIPWSDTFTDIQGKDCGPSSSPSSSTSSITTSSSATIPITKFKALWDDSFLYIIAILYPSPDFPTTATYTQRNSPIFQQDSDFEIFIDPMGSNHNYKELEVNAFNTVWNLMLNKPYLDDGYEHSARVTNDTHDRSRYYEVYHQHTATQLLNGTTVNNPTGEGALWVFETALAWTDIYNYTTTTAASFSPRSLQQSTVSSSSSSSSCLPTNRFIRINFSRVELKGSINWTWQPQYVYDPIQRAYIGVIDMHRPEAWGYFVLHNDTSTATIAASTTTTTTATTATTTTTTPRMKANLTNDDASCSCCCYCQDPTWPARIAAMQVYAAQRVYYSNHGFYTNDWIQLISYLDPDIVSSFHIHIECMSNSDGNIASSQQQQKQQHHYLATISHQKKMKQDDNFQCIHDNFVITVADDRLLRVIPDNTTIFV
jgi:hypothetical protein